MVEMQSARLKRAGIARCLLEARDFSHVRLHIEQQDWEDIILSNEEYTQILSMNPNNSISTSATFEAGADSANKSRAGIIGLQIY